MKKLIAMLALVASFSALTTTAVEARDTRSSSGHSHSHSNSSSYHGSSHYGSKKAPLVRKRVVIGHDRRGRAIYAWRYVRVKSYYSHNHNSHHGSKYSSSRSRSRSFRR